MKRLFTDYPRILLFACAIVISTLLYRQGSFHWITEHLDGFGYPSIVLAGLLYSFGFTSPFAVAYFIEMAPHVSPIPAALLGGIGAATADAGIFEFVALSMREELVRLRTTRIFQRITALLHHETLPERLQRAWRWLFAAVVIASPLPDEVGMSLIAGMTDIESRRITVACFILNTLGILLILLLAR